MIASIGGLGPLLSAAPAAAGAKPAVAAQPFEDRLSRPEQADGTADDTAPSPAPKAQDANSDLAPDAVPLTAEPEPRDDTATDPALALPAVLPPPNPAPLPALTPTLPGPQLVESAVLPPLPSTPLVAALRQVQLTEAPAAETTADPAPKAQPTPAPDSGTPPAPVALAPADPIDALAPPMVTAAEPAVEAASALPTRPAPGSQTAVPTAAVPPGDFAADLSKPPATPDAPTAKTLPEGPAESPSPRRSPVPSSTPSPAPAPSATAPDLQIEFAADARAETFGPLTGSGPDPLRSAAAPTAAAGLDNAPGSAEARPSQPLLRNVLDRLDEIEVSEGRTRLLLRPQGLGMLEIDLARLVDGRLHLAIRAENPLILEALRQEGDALNAFMNARGFDLSGGQPDLSRYSPPKPDHPATAESGGSEGSADTQTETRTEAAAPRNLLSAERLDILT